MTDYDNLRLERLLSAFNHLPNKKTSNLVIRLLSEGRGKRIGKNQFKDVSVSVIVTHVEEGISSSMVIPMPIHNGLEEYQEAGRKIIDSAQALGNNARVVYNSVQVAERIETKGPYDLW